MAQLVESLDPNVKLCRVMTTPQLHSKDVLEYTLSPRHNLCCHCHWLHEFCICAQYIRLAAQGTYASRLWNCNGLVNGDVGTDDVSLSQSATSFLSPSQSTSMMFTTLYWFPWPFNSPFHTILKWAGWSDHLGSKANNEAHQIVFCPLAPH